MRALQAFLVGTTVLALIGCTRYQAPPYTAAPDSLDALKTAPNIYDVSLVSTTSNDDGAIMCRGAGPVTVGKGKIYASYIVDALAQDLKNANVYSERSTNLIQATYSKIDFQSPLGAANWYINGVYRIGNESVSINTVYNDRSSFSAHTACRNMATYFSKAVAAHLQELYNSRLFKNTYAAPNDAKGSLTTKLEDLKQAFDAGLIPAAEYEAKRREIVTEY